MPEEKEDRQDGEQVDPGRDPAEPGEPAVLEVSVEEGGTGGYDLSRLEIGGDEEDGVLPHFLGDSSLLYSADAPGSTPSRRMMVFQGSVAGHQAVVLLDLGANANFVRRSGCSAKASLRGSSTLLWRSPPPQDEPTPLPLS